jgi:two-component system, NtrC family, nitrogen regulation sensor histidine kinase NtrY
MASRKEPARAAPFERRIWLLCVGIAAPFFLLALFLLWHGKFSRGSSITLLSLCGLLSLVAAGFLMEQIVRPLQTLANVVSALKESDYSFRARGAMKEDALGELALEINEFADVLQKQRMVEMEASNLLQCVISSMEAPVLAFDPEHRLRLINPAGERIFHLTAAAALGQTAGELQLTSVLEQPDRGILVLPARGNPVHWLIRTSDFRQEGIPHVLIVLSDVSVALREQERDAWQRLIRVIGHEINNSLTPIKSIAGSLRALMVSRSVTDPAVTLDRGLGIIETRAESLNRFIQAYRQLAQLPPPAFRQVALHALIERAAGLETRVPVELIPGSEVVLQLDPDQIEQLIINLLRNAAEAATATAEHPQVTVTWRRIPHGVVILIEDNGAGLSNPSNIFVPFYTTKPGGSGIGLALARQITEAHGGVLRIANRTDAQGCVAEVRLPASFREEETVATQDQPQATLQA